MGYLREFREKLTEKLQTLDEKSRQDVTNFVASAVLESYRNGQKSRVGSAQKDEQKSGAAKRPRGKWQQRSA